jgi:hypothetical protein
MQSVLTSPDRSLATAPSELQPFVATAAATTTALPSSNQNVFSTLCFCFSFCF